MEGQEYSLRQPLPAEVLVGGGAAWGRYRRWPAFSRNWLAGRSLLFCSVIAVLALGIGVTNGLLVNDPMVGVKIGLVQFVGFGLMATLGPALATWVRHRGWAEARERKAVVIAVIVGMVLSYFVDQTASAYAEEVMRPGLAALGIKPQAPQLEPWARGLLLALNLVGIVVVYGLFGGGLALRAYFSERRRWSDHHHAQAMSMVESRAREADLRLGVLQAQVEPHFLFNTLASVRALVRQDPAQAEATLDALVGFLRATIPKLRDGQSLHATLGQQLEICASYLELMRVRMGGRLTYTMSVAPELRAHPFPPSLLITLVENAIKHGIEPRPGPGRIDVVAEREGGRLRVRVVDDGAGLKPGVGGGMGLANVRDQLAHRFGDRASLQLQPGPRGGVVAQVEVPCAMEEA